MQKIVYFTFEQNGSPASAQSVVLASPDNAYGIRRVRDGSVVAPNATTVSNPSTGTYQYTFTADVNEVYRVSWKVIADADSAATYTVQDVGPFTADKDVRVQPEQKGTFTKGTYGTVNIRLFDLGGSPFDADNVSVKIVHTASNQELLANTPVKLGRGIYILDWHIPDSTPTGECDVTWSYSVRGTIHRQYQRIVIAESAPDSGAGNSVLALYRIKLEMMLQGIQEIPIYGLEGKVIDDAQTYVFPFKRWNQSAGVKVYRNGTLLLDGYDIDYHNGQIIFDYPNLEQDVVEADFVFRFFSDDELDLFLLNGINMFNLFAPHTQYGFANIPENYIPPVLHGAMMEVISAYQQALTFPQNRVLYRTEELADKAFSNYGSIYDNYAKRWETLSEKKKFFPYRGTIGTVTQNIYVMPGGRARFFRYLFGANAA